MTYSGTATHAILALFHKHRFRLNRLTHIVYPVLQCAPPRTVDLHKACWPPTQSQTGKCQTAVDILHQQFSTASTRRQRRQNATRDRHMDYAQRTDDRQTDRRVICITA